MVIHRGRTITANGISSVCGKFRLRPFQATDNWAATSCKKCLDRRAKVHWLQQRSDGLIHSRSIKALCGSRDPSLLTLVYGKVTCRNCRKVSALLQKTGYKKISIGVEETQGC